MFISVKFQPGDARTYTYRYDGASQALPGEFCLVDTKDGRKAVEIAAVDVPEPPFECKSVVAILTEKVAA